MDVVGPLPVAALEALDAGLVVADLFPQRLDLVLEGGDERRAAVLPLETETVAGRQWRRTGRDPDALMTNFQTTSLVLDLVLIVLGLLTYIRRPRLGGQLNAGMRMLLVGLIMLGFAHMFETALFIFLHLSEDVNEVVHRVFVIIAFMLVLWGFGRMQRALHS